VAGIGSHGYWSDPGSGGKRGHFADSMEGMIKLPLKSFRQRYPFTGFEMVVSKSD
jgi:hypothetical protein